MEVERDSAALDHCQIPSDMVMCNRNWKTGEVVEDWAGIEPRPEKVSVADSEKVGKVF